MAEIKLFFADCAGAPSNCSYPHEAVITDEAILRQVVSCDYVCVAYKNGYRANSNFLNTTCMGMDCDNDHSDNPNDWITPEHIRRSFPDVTFAIHFSRNNMKEKRGKAARPKFHVLFLIDEMTDHTAYSDLKKRVNAVFPYFDTRALDSARFFFGTQNPEVAFYPGSITLNECLELYYPEAVEDAFWDLDSSFSGTIPEGSRNSTMSHFAGRVLKRFGDTEEAYAAFMERAARCEPPLEDVELMTIWRSAQGFYQRVSAQDNYIPPEQWNAERSGRFTYDPDDRTDVGQARLLGKHFSQELRYSPATDYIRYDGACWQETKPGAQAVVHALTDLQLEEAEKAVSDAIEKMTASGAQGLLSENTRKKAEAMMSPDQAEVYLTCTPPTEEDGLTYMLLGTMTSAYATTLFPEHPLYRFVDGAFQSLSQVAYEAYAEVGEVRTEMRTAIEQTNAAIALKADQTTVDTLSERVDSAELKLEPDQLMSTIRSSSQYRYDLYGGRNYILDSDGPFNFEGGYYKYPSGTVSNYTMLQLYTSDDLFAHSGEGTTFRLSFDIKRSSIDAASASTAGVYFGIWVYYKYLASDGTTVSTTGRGYYFRTTDSDFAATDDDWVRLTKGPMNLTTYNPIGIAYVALGTSASLGSTGSLQIRNVKCEVGDAFTDWSAAPEDLNDLPGRMSTAESSITQNANNIALKVSTSTYNTEKVYRGSTAPTTLYTNMLWLDTSVSPNLLKRYTGSTWVVAGAEEVKSSGIYIGPNQVSITTEDFLLQLLDPSDNENVLMEMSANGNVGFKELYADEVISDSVASAYAGSQWLWVEPSIETPTETDFRSLGEAVQVLNNKYLPNDVTIYLPWGWETYEPSGVYIRGISGPGKLTIYGYGDYSILNSYIKVHGCFAHICFQNVYLRESRTLNGSSRQPYLCEVTKCHFVEFSGCTLDANGITYDSVYARSSHVFLYSCGLYNALQGLECYLAQGTMKDCCGSCSWAMVSYASLIIASGTVPAGSRGTGENGQLFASSVTTDYGTSIPTVTPDETGLLYATTTKSWRGSWRTDTYDVIQGVYYDSGYNSSLNWNRGCMWFGNAQNLLSGCTVKSATLTLHRKTGSGSSAAKKVYLCAISNTSASGTPSIVYNYGSIGTIGRDKQVTFSIPVDAVQGLADGYYGGLCLYETPYDFGSSTYSNAYMRMSGTDTNYEPYIECVFSGSTAVG